MTLQSFLSHADGSTNLQNCYSSELWGLDQLPYFCVNVLFTYFRVGLFICMNHMWKWSSLWFSSSGFAEWCLGEVQSQEREWCHYEHFHCWDSMQPVSQDDIHPDKWSQPFSFQRANGFVAWTITLETGANKYPSSSSSLTYLRTLVIVVVTNLFANTRHHRHH